MSYFFSSSSSSSARSRGEVHHHLEESIRPYIDLIDTLRSVGIQKDLALPTIVVIGDQSSGKSSVLEALSGIALPRGSGIVTRCPLELRLRNVTGGVSWKAVLSYRKKKIEKTAEAVEKHVEEAQNELAGKGVKICDDLITLEVRSADVCDLTLIDLPGIARVPVQGQPQDIGNQIKRLIMKFIEKQETINMVVVPCNIDIATTEALKMAQEIDPEGIRTLAILTKPDLIDRGTEKNILAVVQNKVIPLRKGYVMVKCRGQQQIDEKIPLVEATQIERDFFQNHDFFRLRSKRKYNLTFVDISVYAVCTTKYLKRWKSLPKLDEQIKKQLWDVRNELKECEAGPPQDLKGAKQFLIKVRIEFMLLRIIIRAESTAKILFSFLYEKKNPSCSQQVDSSKELSQNYRGRELLGFSNYRVFEMILQDRMAKLKEPAIKSLNSIKGTLTSCSSSSQQAKTEQRIMDQFEMESMIYTQDPIYLKFLNEISSEKFSEAQLPVFDIKSKYSEMLQAYYEVHLVFINEFERMADQLPMLISFYMLKETAQLLCTDMLSILEGANVSELLFEDSDVSKRRKYLQSRLGRLTAAQEALSDFI
uniref:Interferon-induced GTP-binding protein Mx2-like n=1 Tax=Sinocyclocheilus grahami TaxID=75366 RepID=A0A672RBX3_SINGR